LKTLTFGKYLFPLIGIMKETTIKGFKRTKVRSHDPLQNLFFPIKRATTSKGF
jgi:hypothetical protein